MKTLKTKTRKRLLSLLLIAAMFVTMQGIPVQAQTVGHEAKEKEMPSNPVHHCTKKDDETDTTDWSYVYFGSYPQTEITGSALTSAITEASYDTNGDAWVNGTKYRRIKKSDANNNYSGEHFFSWNGDNDYHYFKWERIKWRVLQNNGSTLFVVADKGLDCKGYNEEYTSITWENCTLRNWLNSSFYSTAFSSREQGAIISQNVVNEDNPSYGTEGGNNTTDKVYLLSIGEVTNSSYGFCEIRSTWSASRRMKPSDYAHARGVEIINSSTSKGNCMWWLRWIGHDTIYAANVGVEGYAKSEGWDGRVGSPVNMKNVQVVPALHINLSSDLWSVLDDGTSGEGGGNAPEYITFQYQSDNKDYTAEYHYTDNYFTQSSYTYNHSLATMSLCFAMSAFGSGEGTDYKDKSKNARALLEQIGFDNIQVNEDFTVKPSTDSIGAIAGRKQIHSEDKDYTLIALAIRGAGYEKEWASNFTIGTNGHHTGFFQARNNVIVFLKKYLMEQEQPITGDVKFWITGYSRAAATANLTGAAVNDGMVKTSDISYSRDDVYTYCFETPAGALEENADNAIYNNIINIINSNDPVPYVAPAALGFRRYGTDLYLPSAEITSSGYDKKKEEMLKIYNSLPSINLENKEEAEKKKYCVDGFHMKKLTVENWFPGGEKISFIKDDTKNNYSQGVFLSKYLTILSKDFIKSRENYVGMYQQGIREICSMFLGEEKSGTLKEVMLSRLEEQWKELLKAYVTNSLKFKEKDGLEIISAWLMDSLQEAGITDYDRETLEEATACLADMLLAAVLSHPNYCTTAVMNVSGLGQAHYPELCYAWMVSMDKNYNADAEPKLSYNGSYRVILINCDVDVDVTDDKGNLVASIKNEEPQEIKDSSIISSINENGEKEIILPADANYEVSITGRSDGMVNYAVNEYCALTGDYTRVVNYFDVSLGAGESLEGEIPAYTSTEIENDTPNGSEAEYTLSNQKEGLLQKDSDLCGEEASNAYYTVTVNTSNEQYGIVTGSGVRQYGNFAQAEAFASENCVFVGWYKGQQLVSKDAVYRFAVVEDTELVAKFEKNKNSEETSTKTSISKAKITLKKSSYTYSGKAKKPAVTVKVGSKKLTKNKDYKLTYKNNKKVGTATVKITGTGNYTGTITKTFKILPKGTLISGKIKVNSKGFTVTWKKQKSAKGYQVQYSTSKKFSKKATITKTLKKKSMVKLTVSKLKANKKYYVRVRTYQTVKGKKYYSVWSKSKKVTTKK